MLSSRLLDRLVFHQNGCWVWTGPRFKSGYGQVRFEGKTVRVHRLVFRLLSGELPSVLHHTCNNKLCCNPAHLQGMERSSHSREHSTGRIKSACKRGHAMQGQNLRIASDGHRICATCKREYMRAYRKRIHQKEDSASRAEPVKWQQEDREVKTCCPTCHGNLTENHRVAIRGALCYHVDCVPSSANAPRTIWQALLTLVGIGQ